MARVLIIGADSAIGDAAGRAMMLRGDAVIGTTRRIDSAGPGRLPLDLLDPAVGRVPLPTVDVAVICAAMARFADCREQPALARRINVEAPAILTERLLATGARIILLSTSAVFDCATPHRRAEEPTSPRSAYGALKAEAEAALLAMGPSVSVLRLTKVLTSAMPLFSGWIKAFRDGRPVTAFEDHTFSPLTLDDVVDALIAVVGDGGEGIYQVSGADDVSYAQAARHLANRCLVGAELVKGVLATQNGISASELAHFTTLDCRRLTALTGWSPPRAIDVIDGLFGATDPRRT